MGKENNKIFWQQLLIEGPHLLVRQQKEPTILRNIQDICIASNGRKADYINHYITQTFINENTPICVTRERPTWHEENASRPKMIGLSAVLKSGVINDEEQEKVTISNDVQLLKDDKVELHRLNDSSLIEQLYETLTEQRNFKVFSTTAISANTRGYYSTDSHSFTITPLTSEEIGEYVSDVNHELLTRSPGGLLWPHPILRKHIAEIDELRKDTRDFEERLMILYRSLLGIPDSNGGFISAVDSLLGQGTIDDQVDIFRFVRKYLPLNNEQKLLGVWQEIATLNDGSNIIISNALDQDYLPISTMAENNFREAENYSYLRELGNEVELEKYIEANSPNNIVETCSKVNALCNLVAKSTDGKLLGFRLVRKDGNIANGRRLHVGLDSISNGIGKILINRSEELARQAGCDVIEIHATGKSTYWFEKLGYDNKGEVPNNSGVFNDKPTAYTLLTKNL